MGIRDYEEFPWHLVEFGPGGHLLETIAVSKHFSVARAGFFALLPHRPGRAIFLMQGARIILDSAEEGDSGIDPLKA